MHVPPDATSRPAPWWRQLSGYHWFVFTVASAAWFFDCLDQRLFSLARIPALTALMPGSTGGEIQAEGKIVTALFLVGWGIGGLFFGALGDRFGRSRMLSLTVLLYSICTGASFFSRSAWDFSLFRFLTGAGVGGVFGLAVAIIAETVPGPARPGALGMLQVLSTVGNICAVFVKMAIDQCESSGLISPGHGWRWMFLAGAIPALLVVLSQGRLKETEPWLKARHEGKLAQGNLFTPYAALLRDTRWRRNLWVGAAIASTGVIGLWAIGEYMVDVQRSVFNNHFQALGTPDLKARVNTAITHAYLLQMLGGAVGMSLFTQIAIRLGRRPAFAIGFLAALFVTAFVFWKMTTPLDAYWMCFLMGACQLGVFAGFSIYLPELFPSRMRSTGVSFCYNLGRFAAAGGSFFSAQLALTFYGHLGSPTMERYAAITMCGIFLLGILVLPFAPETRGLPLPEEEKSPN